MASALGHRGSSVVLLDVCYIATPQKTELESLRISGKVRELTGIDGAQLCFSKLRLSAPAVSHNRIPL